ncbi:hypothetical protein CEW89_18600 [Celeribacter ethanolicus]|uniref:Uncharacterized protein n=1 Tax=Celeribacter ethanolicus TaxID=1758178 RepID=A0A291GGW0_9RHOB|nr:hypothetical protein CEW89_18600 [Celeribacter ethanolicus]
MVREREGGSVPLTAHKRQAAWAQKRWPAAPAVFIPGQGQQSVWSCDMAEATVCVGDIACSASLPGTERKVMDHRSKRIRTRRMMSPMSCGAL